MTIEIRMNYFTHGGERVCIAGASNKWEPRQMEPVNGHAEDGWWCAKLDIPEGCIKHDIANLEYKFVVLRDNGCNRWEECNNRTVSVEMPSKKCHLSFTDFWAYPLVSKLEITQEVSTKKPEPVMEKKPEPVMEKKVEKKPEPVVEKKAEPIVEKKVEKKPEPVVEKKAEPVVEKKVEKKPEPVVEKKAEPVVEKKVEKKPEPVVEKKPEPVAEKKPEPVAEKKPEPAADKKAEALEKRKSRNSLRLSSSSSFKADEEPKRETVTLRHVEPKAEEPKQIPKHKKSGSIVEDCKKVFEPDGTPVEVPQFLRNSMRNSNSSSGSFRASNNSSKRLSKYQN